MCKSIKPIAENLCSNIAEKSLTTMIETAQLTATSNVKAREIRLRKTPGKKSSYWTINARGNGNDYVAMYDMTTGAKQVTIATEVLNNAPLGKTAKFNGQTYVLREANGKPFYSCKK